MPGARLGVGARVVGVEAQHALKVQGPLVGPQRGGLPEGEGRLGVRRGGRQERHNLPLLGDALRSQQRRKHRLGVARPKELAGQGARILFAQCTGALGVARDARVGPVGADVGREHQAHLRAVQVLDAHLGPVLAAPVRQRRGVQSLHRGHQRVLRLGVQVDGPAGHAVLDDVGVGGGDGRDHGVLPARTLPNLQDGEAQAPRAPDGVAEGEGDPLLAGGIVVHVRAQVELHRGVVALHQDALGHGVGIEELLGLEEARLDGERVDVAALGVAQLDPLPRARALGALRPGKLVVVEKNIVGPMVEALLVEHRGGHGTAYLRGLGRRRGTRKATRSQAQRNPGRHHEHSLRVRHSLSRLLFAPNWLQPDCTGLRAAAPPQWCRKAYGTPTPPHR